MLRAHHDDMMRIGKELFGEDTKKWVFKCPSCGHEQSIASVLEHNPELKGNLGWIYQNCEGRHVEGHGCNWTLGGLFQVHNVEYFHSGVFVPAFEFAHDDFPRLIAEAAAAFVAPVYPTTEAETWADYNWEDWIPSSVREEIVSFWDGSGHGGPKKWLESVKKRGGPPLGQEGEFELIGGKKTVRGRFVHCWNNIGRAVLPDGSVEYVSF